MNNRTLLQRLVELAGGARDRGYILALEPEGLSDLPETLMAGSVRYVVAKVGSELGLRRLLGQMGGATGAPFIAFLPEALARRLPPDLLRRAQRERVHALAPAEILGIALGAPVQGLDHAEQVELAFRHLDTLRAGLAGGDTLPTFVDGDLVDELLADAVLRRKLRSLDPGGVLAALIKCPSPVDGAEARLLGRLLPRRFGSEGRVLAWALAGPERLGALVEHGILLAIDAPGLPPVVWGPLNDALRDADVGLPEAQLRRICAALAEGALAALDAASQARLLRSAESKGRQLLQPALLARSRWLTLGLDNRCAELARQAAAGQAVTAEDVAELGRHHAHADRAHDITLVDALARLSRYGAADHSPLGHGVAAHLARYRRAGAWGDLAALRLQRAMAASDRFRHEAQSVLARWRERRDAENLAFARLLAEDYVGALHAEGVIPIHKVWHAEVQARLTKGRPVLVLLLDGCSYPVFLELLEQLADPTAPGGGVGLPRLPDLALSEGLPGMAILPSVTSHSRGALWLGQIPKDPLVAELNWDAAKEAATDPARFKQNAALGSRSRRLFLKGELQADGGAALRAAVTDPALEVVAAVFNAIDDSIGSSATGQPLEIRAERISGLLPALRAALDTDRDILLLADHGHSLHEGTGLRVGAGSTPRYTAVAPGSTVPEGFLTIDLTGLGGSTETQAFAWRMGAYLGSRPQVGYHGGCSLEELAIPLAWLERGGTAADPPGWWFGGMDVAQVASNASAPSRQLDSNGSGGALAPRRKAVSPPAVEPSAPPTSAIQSEQAMPGPDGAAALAADVPPLSWAIQPQFLSELDELQQRAMWLLQQHKAVTVGELAGALDFRPSRVSGFMNGLNRHLAALGCQCFRTETLPSGEQQYVFIPQEPLP